MPSTKIFLTGHRGFIGAALKERIASLYPAELVALDSDLRDAGQIQAELAGFECDRALVLHLATINRRACGTYDGHAANCAMLANLLKATDHFTRRHFLFASSTDVYGRPTSLPVTESTPHQPLDWYGLSKSVGESMLRLTTPDCAIFRLPGVFGARPNERSLLRLLLEQGLKEGTVKLSSMGKTLRDFVYLDDLVALIAAWLEAPRSGVWNIASGQSTSLFASLTQLRHEAEASFEILQAPEKSDRDFDLVFDPTKLRADFPSTRLRPAAGVFKEYLAATLSHCTVA